MEGGTCKVCKMQFPIAEMKLLASKRSAGSKVDFRGETLENLLDCDLELLKPSHVYDEFLTENEKNLPNGAVRLFF